MVIDDSEGVKYSQAGRKTTDKQSNKQKYYCWGSSGKRKSPNRSNKEYLYTVDSMIRNISQPIDRTIIFLPVCSVHIPSALGSFSRKISPRPHFVPYSAEPALRHSLFRQDQRQDKHRQHSCGFHLENGSVSETTTTQCLTDHKTYLIHFILKHYHTNVLL